MTRESGNFVCFDISGYSFSGFDEGTWALRCFLFSIYQLVEHGLKNKSCQEMKHGCLLAI